MDISKYIKDLLFEHDYVIVPGFGAFVSNYKPAYIDEEEDLYYPPSKEITFNSKLVNDDHLLVRYILHKENSFEKEVLKGVKEFCESAQYQLSNDEKVEIEGLGYLFVDNKQNIQFHSNPSDNLLNTAYGLKPTSLKPENGLAENKKVEQPILKKRKVWIWFLIIPVLIGAIFISINEIIPPETVPDNPIENEIVETPVSTDTITTSDTTVALIDTSKLKDTIVNEALAKSELEYYLIGGSFKAKENADKYFKKVTRMGYQPLHLGQQGNFYIVAIGVYKSEAEAVSAKREFLDREPNSGVWVLEKE